MAELPINVEEKNLDEKKELYKSIEMMDKLFYAKIKVSQIAKSVHLSEYHFIRKFRKNFGLTPYRYFMKMKLEKAFTALIAGRKLANVAVQYGYCDQAHLHRSIKKNYGYTLFTIQSIGK